MNIKILIEEYVETLNLKLIVVSIHLENEKTEELSKVYQFKADGKTLDI